MAELAGSIIGIISAGTKVTLVLSQLASDIGSAGQEARMISSEIRNFCTILNTLKDAIEKVQSSVYFAHCYDMIQSMTDASTEMFTEVLNAAETLRGMAKTKDGRDGKFGLISKFHWVVFQKPKIVVLRAALEAYKSNIALMLGTINIVEKVARPSSFLQTRTTTTEVDQDRTTLQSLELDCRSSLISLEEAEIRYNAEMSRTPSKQNDSFEKSLLDPIPDSEIVMSCETLDDTESHRRHELYLARVEVASMSCSLFARTSEGQEGLQAQMVRHSQRLSKLLEADHWRLSQRWSTLGSSNMDELVPTSYTGPSVNDAAQNSLMTKARDSELSFTAIGQEAVYVEFRTWLLRQPWSDQDKMLKELREDVLSDRLPGEYITPSVFSNDCDPTPPLLNAMPIVQGRVAPSAPRIVTVRNANDSIIPIPSSIHGIPDHKRSRSDSILAHGTFNGRREAMRTRDETFFRLTGTRPGDVQQW